MSSTTQLRRLAVLAILTALVSGGPTAMAAKRFGPVTFWGDAKKRGSGRGTWGLDGDLQRSVMRSHEVVANDGYSVFPAIDQWYRAPSSEVTCDTAKSCSAGSGEKWFKAKHFRLPNLGMRVRRDLAVTGFPGDALRVKGTHKICWDKPHRPDKCGTSSTKREDL